MTEPVPTLPEIPEPSAPPVVPPVAPPPAEKDWQAEAEKWKQFSRQNEDRAKANADAAKTLKSIQDRDLSELDKAKAQIEELQQRAVSAERSKLRSDVALAKGLPAEVVGALVGDTAEELTAHADALLKWRGSAVPAAPAAPRPDPSQGAQPVSQTAADEAEWQQYKALVFPNS